MNFSQQTFGIETFIQWPRVNDPWAKEDLWDVLLKTGLKKKGNYQKRQDWGPDCPSGFFFGSTRWTFHLPFLGSEVDPQKKGAKKGGSLFFDTDGLFSPFFSKDIL